MRFLTIDTKNWAIMNTSNLSDKVWVLICSMPWLSIQIPSWTTKNCFLVTTVSSYLSFFTSPLDFLGCLQHVNQPTACFFSPIPESPNTTQQFPTARNRSQQIIHPWSSSHQPIIDNILHMWMSSLQHLLLGWLLWASNIFNNLFLEQLRNLLDMNMNMSIYRT